MKKEIFCRVWTKEGPQDLTTEQWVDFDRTKLHRSDNPAYEEADETKEWFINGKRHRLDGPAIELLNGTKLWCVDGKLHRLDGPAIEGADGTKWWYLDDKKLPNDKVEDWLKENKIDLTTQEGQMAFKLKWS